MDVRPGGAWRICLRSTEGGPDLWQGGRLVFTFAWEEEGERGLETLVTMTLTSAGSKTRIIFRQTSFQSDKKRHGHQWGWNSAFDRLNEQLPRPSGSDP